MKNKVINSPIRWAGSKKKILNEMLNFFDKTSKIYIEPFLGSGVVLINLINNIEEFDFEEIYVNDINSNIINFYKLLKDDYEYAEKQIKKIINKYNSFSNENSKEEFFYDIRLKYNKIDKSHKIKSIYFYFLMKSGYNGVYRENKKGEFNVPFGRKEKINFDSESLKFIAEKLEKVKFFNYDYIEFFNMLKKMKVLKDAFIYFDPPYIPEEKVISKKQELYTNKTFDHNEFVKYIKQINSNKILISMSESKKADKIYKDFKKYKVDEIIRTINPKKIIKSTEILYSNYIIKKEKKTYKEKP